MTYGAETWTLTNKMERDLVTWEGKILKKIYGPTCENRYWRIKSNQEICNKFRCPDIVTVTEVCRQECCESGWRKDCEEVTDRQTGRREKEKEDVD